MSELYSLAASHSQDTLSCEQDGPTCSQVPDEHTVREGLKSGAVLVYSPRECHFHTGCFGNHVHKE